MYCACAQIQMIGGLAAHMLKPMPAPGEPSSLLAEPVDLLSGYLDYFEDVTLRKIGGLTEDQLRHSSVPSGWTPLGMIKHLAGTERFWIRHVFLGEQIDFADDPASEWRIEASDSTDSIIAFYRSERAYTRHVLAGISAATPAKRSLCPEASSPPTLAWILFHLLQAAARHAGHLDIVRELTDGIVDR
jgi:uncharacterized damage-inducible protein DinB